MGLNVRPNNRQFPEGVTFHSGSQWWVISGEAAWFILDYLEEKPQFYRAFVDCLTPDQSYFQTLLMSSKLDAHHAGDMLTYLKFGDTFRTKNHPVPIRLGEVDKISSSGKFFARKFNPKVDSAVVRHYLDSLG